MKVLKAINLKEWVICSDCGCKLAKINDKSLVYNLEIKCHQCKSINNIEVGGR